MNTNANANANANDDADRARLVRVACLDGFASLFDGLRQGKYERLLDVLDSNIGASPFGFCYKRLLAPRVIFLLLALYTVLFSGTVFSYVYTFLSYGVFALLCSIPHMMLSDDDAVAEAVRNLQRSIWRTFRLRVLMHFVSLGVLAWALDLPSMAQALLAMSPFFVPAVSGLNRMKAWEDIKLMYQIYS